MNMTGGGWNAVLREKVRVKVWQIFPNLLL